jgi:hypothetical protein
MKEMLTAVAGGADALAARPIAVFDVCPSPPLLWSDLTCQNLIDCARAGIPAELVSMPLAGATAPVTLAAAVVQHTAECLSGIVIGQLAEPGAKIVWGGSPAAFDMREGTTPMGDVGTWMIDCAYAQVGKSLGLPTHAYLGMSDAKVIDAQCGMESAGGTLLGDLKGAPLRSSLVGARYSQPGLLATGEAIGSTYSFTGEGIGKAMETGLLAAESLLAARDGALDDAALAAHYEAGLNRLRPKFDLYEKGNRVNYHPWLTEILIRRAARSPRLRQRMSNLLEERATPAQLMTMRGLYKLFVE